MRGVYMSSMPWNYLYRSTKQVLECLSDLIFQKKLYAKLVAYGNIVESKIIYLDYHIMGSCRVFLGLASSLVLSNYLRVKTLEILWQRDCFHHSATI